MWIFVLLVLFVLGISLYDFYVSRVWQELQVGDDHSAKVRARHRRAATLRRTYNRVMLFTVGGLIVALVLSFYTRSIVSNMYPASQVEKPKYDTIQMSLEAPPLEDIRTMQENVKIEGNAGIDQEAQEEREKSDGQKPQETASPPDNPLKSNERPASVTDDQKNNLRTTSDKDLYDQSQRQYSEMMQRKSQREQQREQARQDQLRKMQDGRTKPVNNQPASKSGTADVDWNRSYRKAYQSREDYVPTPKYMCDEGGKVIILVKVGSDGYVKSATPQSSGAAGCLVEEAQRYAMKARFESSSKPLDEIRLTYTFYK
jgi:outer membrane biosynthesis protein TonB